MACSSPLTAMRLTHRFGCYGVNRLNFRAGKKHASLTCIPCQPVTSAASARSSTMKDIDEELNFRVLDIWPKKRDIFFEKRPERRRFKSVMNTPRTERMPIDQDWSNVWPAATSFKPSAVPLPVRMGKRYRGSPAPDKWGNAELMKIPNFLHLTPNAIEKQCEALKQFCTSWPKSLAKDAECEKQFPVKLFTNTYLYSGTKLRNYKAGAISLRFKLSSLPLDYHARDKFLRLLGDRYDPESDYVSLICHRCPYRVQNVQHAEYLLTALFFEAWKTEEWETGKEREDWERLYWEKSPSRQALSDILIQSRRAKGQRAVAGSTEQPESGSEMQLPILQQIAEISDDELQSPDYNIEHVGDIKNYADSVRNIQDGNDQPDAYEQYKKSVEKLLFG